MIAKLVFTDTDDPDVVRMNVENVLSDHPTRAQQLMKELFVWLQRSKVIAQDEVKTTSDAVTILHNRYIKGSKKRLKRLEKEREKLSESTLETVRKVRAGDYGG